MLFLRKRRWAEERELERQYMSMRAACEHLRLMDSNGNKVSEEEATRILTVGDAVDHVLAHIAA